MLCYTSKKEHSLGQKVLLQTFRPFGKEWERIYVSWSSLLDKTKVAVESYAKEFPG